MPSGWWRGELGRAIVIVLIAGVVTGYGGSSSASYAGAASAEVSDISGAALQTSDAPAGYTQRHVKLFPKYQAKMKLGGSSCNTPTVVSKRTWKQGLFAELDKRNAGAINAIDECIWLLSNDSTAHSAYMQGVAQQKSTKGVKLLSVPKVGNEQTAVGSSSPITLYGEFFRHSNALVQITYVTIDKPDLSVSAFGRLAVNVDSRLK